MKNFPQGNFWEKVASETWTGDLVQKTDAWTHVDAWNVLNRNSVGN